MRVQEALLTGIFRSSPEGRREQEKESVRERVSFPFQWQARCPQLSVRRRIY